ncbi:Fur family transcriptional regulator [Kribbella sp. C-35]|uniref:Fur family transcriptional regulator n=1 Tax=Kribbella sp. C-35 TaxID=2789276 RepID=UPI00397ABE99
MQVRIADPAAALRASSLRVTKQRLAVVGALRRAPHSDLDSVRDAVRADIGSISTQAIYDLLAALVRAGLVRRLALGGWPVRFELCEPNHHHVACRSCGAVADVEAVPTLRPARGHGYRIDQTEVTHWGSCPSCRSAGAPPHQEEGR